MTENTVAAEVTFKSLSRNKILHINVYGICYKWSNCLKFALGGLNMIFDSKFLFITTWINLLKKGLIDLKLDSASVQPMLFVKIPSSISFYEIFSSRTAQKLTVTHTFFFCFFFCFVFLITTFISTARLKLAKNQANAKQHPKAELLTFENNSHSSSSLSTKNNNRYSKKFEFLKQIFLWFW